VLTETQLRRALFVALIQKKNADEKLKLADAAIAAADDLHIADAAEKQALRDERETFARISKSKTAEIEQLTKAIDNYQRANVAASTRADNAEREVTRQKGKIKFWKNTARAAILAAFALGFSRKF
jgi:NCAIR mutase (PurE)-related protein